MTGYEELVALQEDCVSAKTNDPEELLAWIENIGIDKDDFARFLDMLGGAGVLAASMAKTMGAKPERFLSAMFASGFELGVRYQQSREVKV